MTIYTQNGAENLKFWRERYSRISSAPSIVEPDNSEPSPQTHPRPLSPSALSVSDEFLTAFRLTLPAILLPSSEDELESSLSTRSRSPSPSRTPISVSSEPPYLYVSSRTPSPTPSMPGAWPATPPASPPLEASSSSAQTPRSDTFSLGASHLRTTSFTSSGSIATNGTSVSGMPASGDAKIRAANDIGLRTKRSLKNFHRYRNSWSSPRRLESEPPLPTMHATDPNGSVESVNAFFPPSIRVEPSARLATA
jgi:hypothetical protein